MTYWPRCMWNDLIIYARDWWFKWDISVVSGKSKTNFLRGYCKLGIVSFVFLPDWHGTSWSALNLVLSSFSTLVRLFVITFAVFWLTTIAIWCCLASFPCLISDHSYKLLSTFCIRMWQAFNIRSHLPCFRLKVGHSRHFSHKHKPSLNVSSSTLHLYKFWDLLTHKAFL